MLRAKRNVARKIEEAIEVYTRTANLADFLHTMFVHRGFVAVVCSDHETRPMTIGKDHDFSAVPAFQRNRVYQLSPLQSA